MQLKVPGRSSADLQSAVSPNCIRLRHGTSTSIETGHALADYKSAIQQRYSRLKICATHAALPGICIAFLITGQRELFALSVGALATGLLGIGVMTVIRRWTRTKEDAAIGIVLSTFFGAGVILLSIIQQQPSGNQAGLQSYLFGETAGITRRNSARNGSRCPGRTSIVAIT